MIVSLTPGEVALEALQRMIYVHCVALSRIQEFNAEQKGSSFLVHGYQRPEKA